MVGYWGIPVGAGGWDDRVCGEEGWRRRSGDLLYMEAEIKGEAAAGSLLQSWGETKGLTLVERKRG